jgi:multidrug resistance efflux pump
VVSRNEEIAVGNWVDRLETLRTVIAELAGVVDPGELSSAALGGALTAVKADAGSLWLGGADGMVCQVAAGRDAKRLVGMTLPAAEVSALRNGDGSALVVALADRGETIGAIRVAREDEGAAPFDAVDEAMLTSLAASVGLAIGTANRVRAADRSADFALLGEMGREITSTLDLDRVLRAAVNLAARAMAFDRAAIGLYDGGVCDIRAIAGADTVDATDPAVQDLAARGAWAAGTGEAFYLSDRTEAASDAERIFLQIFGDDLARADVQSGLYMPLKDEEGIVGILFFEAARTDFAAPRQREVAGILAAQAAVAIRNAQLYKQVPLADALGAFNVRWKALLGVPRRRRVAYGVGAAVVLGAVTLPQWPLRVEGMHPAFRQSGGAQARALVGGMIQRIFVTEGERVTRGAALAQLSDADLRAQRDAALADASADDREAELAASRGDAGQERVARLRGESRRRVAALADDQLRFTLIRSPVDGVVLTPRPEERVGIRVDAGDPVVLVGRTDTLELEFGVDEQDLVRVRVGQEVRARADALPQYTLVGHVVAIGGLPSDSAADAAGNVAFPVRARVPNVDGTLRPGMAAAARVLTAPVSLAGRLLRAPLRTARLLWWRLSS